MRKSERGLQIAAAVIITLFVIALAVFTAIAYLPFVTDSSANFGAPIITLRDGITEISSDLGINPLLTVSLFMAVPALLLALSAAVLFSSYRGKSAKYVVFAVIAILLLTALSCLSFLAGGKLFGEGYVAYAAAVAALPVTAVVLLVTSLFIGGKKTAVQADAEQTAEELPEEQSDTAAETSPNRFDAAEIYNEETLPLYTPEERETVSEIVDRTYGAAADTDKTVTDEKTVAQLKRVRDLFEAGAISEYEYDQLVLRFLNRR